MEPSGTLPKKIPHVVSLSCFVNSSLPGIKESTTDILVNMPLACMHHGMWRWLFLKCLQVILGVIEVYIKFQVKNVLACGWHVACSPARGVCAVAWLHGCSPRPSCMLMFFCYVLPSAVHKCVMQYAAIERLCNIRLLRVNCVVCSPVSNYRRCIGYYRSMFCFN